MRSMGKKRRRSSSRRARWTCGKSTCGMRPFRCLTRKSNSTRTIWRAGSTRRRRQSTVRRIGMARAAARAIGGVIWPPNGAASENEEPERPTKRGQLDNKADIYSPRRRTDLTTESPEHFASIPLVCQTMAVATAPACEPHRRLHSTPGPSGKRNTRDKARPTGRASCRCEAAIPANALNSLAMAWNWHRSEFCRLSQTSKSRTSSIAFVPAKLVI